MDPAAAQAAQAALVTALKEALSCLVLGTVFATWRALLRTVPTYPYLCLTVPSCSVYGVSILQVYIYFQKCREDSTHLGMRSFVSTRSTYM